MSNFKQYPPLLLGENEQVVTAVAGRILPSLSDLLLIFYFAPAWFFAPSLMLHHFFRPISYVITTDRVLALEPCGTIEAINLVDIVQFKGSRKTLILYGTKNRMWLSRLPDAWHFETVICNVMDKVKLEFGE